MEPMAFNFDSIVERFQHYYEAVKEKQLSFQITLLFVPALGLILYLYSIFLSAEPELFDIPQQQQTQAITGTATNYALMTTMRTLLDKRGGYLSNDVMPPFVWLDNIPNWEFGVLVQARDLSLALRNDFSRSQSQSIEDKDLIIAQPQFHFNSESWILPATETEYEKGINALISYQRRLQDPDSPNAQFYARADNLSNWLGQVEKRLGSLSQRLSASIGQVRLNTDLAGDSAAQQSTSTKADISVKTPWLELDDIFYEARGSTWALLHYLKAIEVDFEAILIKKNALVSLRQIIRELEASQTAISSPFILNGNGFGLFANHSLVMASYISRANSAVIDLKQLLQQG